MIQSENDFTDSSTQKKLKRRLFGRPDQKKEREQGLRKKEGDGPEQLEVVDSALTPFR